MKNLLRLLSILRVLLRHRLDLLLPASHRPAPLRLLLWPLALLPAPVRPPGERLRLACESLGPLFIKFGQMLSTRRDLLPEEIADELKKLQDQVPPFASSEAMALVERDLGQPIEALFSSFDPTPLASASIAQVHAAQLPDGRAVCVKIVRPTIEPVIRRDLALLQRLADFAERNFNDARRLQLSRVVRDYQTTLLDELDLKREAANTMQLRSNFAHSPLLYVPEVHWDYSRPSLLVMERIHGIAVSEIDQLRGAGIDLKKLAERGVEIFFTQVFRHNFFHADMHPGNIFVSTRRPDSPQYIAIDCAIMGALTEADQRYLATILHAFFQRDYQEVARLHSESGWIGAAVPVHDFAAAIRTVCEPIFQKPLKEISLGELLIYLFQTARRFDMEIQPQLVLLQKTLLQIEGLGRQLYPDLDLWSTASPFIQRWMQERSGPRALAGRLLRQLPNWAEQLPELPRRLQQSWLQIDQLGQLQRAQAAALQRLQQGIERRQRRQRLIALLLLVSGLGWLFSSHHDPQGSLSGGGLLSLLAGLWLYAAK
ncbi:MAG TPA: ubiquinone biosynthesis regulatory protein kinase UbiB [Pseudomonadales bacterium]|jgi:ubiquinone biosynthesis protein|nr:ubiquinone biosynthesis regulatory protein kinase UbiB [Pseudomonadales bacterium]HMY95841.1 ubiquinone biosynthesis regulatory protein kinase UbiB [Pseudomonadales bacterium]HMZ90901.1 ubiquinone biosynthesis regulatory protein kinase UbiB [Pseudomonadales bacterium]HND27520.1 ubiquinone biosynthesis regulatory protein kinase UbiB [Pseudomonadales bacterium]HNF73045.1 ubiquinone biosynthesis regulatory protein kinase UbiB [Pseudomonadales bacterium]